MDVPFSKLGLSGIPPELSRDLRRQCMPSELILSQVAQYPEARSTHLDKTIERFAGTGGNEDRIDNFMDSLDAHCNFESAELLLDPSIPEWPIDAAFVARYTAKHLIWNVRLCAGKRNTVFLPSGAPDRWRFKLLVSTGAAIRGAAITPKDRAECMPMASIRRIAALHGIRGRSKAEIAERLCQVPAFTAMLDKSSDNFFQTLPLPGPRDQVLKRLAYLEGLAALIERAQEIATDLRESREY